MGKWLTDDCWKCQPCPQLKTAPTLVNDTNKMSQEAFLGSAANGSSLVHGLDLDLWWRLYLDQVRQTAPLAWRTGYHACCSPDTCAIFLQTNLFPVHQRNDASHETHSFSDKLIPKCLLFNLTLSLTLPMSKLVMWLYHFCLFVYLVFPLYSFLTLMLTVFMENSNNVITGMKFTPCSREGRNAFSLILAAHSKTLLIWGFYVTLPTADTKGSP